MNTEIDCFIKQNGELMVVGLKDYNHEGSYITFECDTYFASDFLMKYWEIKDKIVTIHEDWIDSPITGENGKVEIKKIEIKVDNEMSFISLQIA